MEQYLIYGLVAVVVGLIIWKFPRKKKYGDNTVFIGEVKSKDSNPDNTFSVTAITDDNKTVTAKVSKILWSNLERGDRIEKRKGDQYPRKI